MSAPPKFSAPAPDVGRPLTELANGFSGVLLAVVGPSFVCDRLRELGFLPGEEIRLVMRTPMGEPLIVQARGATLALRKTEARCLRV